MPVHRSVLRNLRIVSILVSFTATAVFYIARTLLRPPSYLQHWYILTDDEHVLRTPHLAARTQMRGVPAHCAYRLRLYPRPSRRRKSFRLQPGQPGGRRCVFARNKHYPRHIRRSSCHRRCHRKHRRKPNRKRLRGGLRHKRRAPEISNHARRPQRELRFTEQRHSYRMPAHLRQRHLYLPHYAEHAGKQLRRALQHHGRCFARKRIRAVHKA